MSYTSKYTGAEIDALLEQVESGGGGGEPSSIVIDSSLSLESENPVQNKVITSYLNNKVDKVEGKELSTNDYTNEDKEKTLILGPHIGNDTEEHQANLLKAVASNACYGRVTINGNSGTYISIGEFGGSYYVDALIHLSGYHIYAPTLERYMVLNGRWIPYYFIEIEKILTSSNLATQSEIDALFDNDTSGDGSTSY